MSKEVGPALERLVGIMARLRSDQGCPWDRQQDLRSLRPYLVEEAYEVLEEMDKVAYGGSWQPLCEELGDLLFQIVFHAQLASELGEFGMAEVCEAIADKIESRHPHVFAGAVVEGAEAVVANWARLKAEEKKRKLGREVSVLEGVPKGAPALMRAERLTEKASRIGFDWPDLAGVRGKLQEELDELDEAIALGGRDAMEHELGDALFSLVNLARFIRSPPEDALRQANARFTRRFHAIEEGLAARGVPFGGATLAQMDELWEAAKATEAQVPRPAHLPRASPVRLVFSTSGFAAQQAFWARLSPLLGWEQKPSPGALDLRLEAGGMEVRFIQQAQGEGHASPARSSEVVLDAPSRASVEALYRALTAILGAAVAPPAPDAEGLYAVRFLDPDKNAWRYSFGA